MSRARTSAAPARRLALLVLEAASGSSFTASWESFGPPGLWSRTSPAARVRGLTRWSAGWTSSGTRAYRSRLRQLMSAHRTFDHGSSSSLLPTLTSKANLLAPSMQKWPAHRLLPTLSAQRYGSNRGGRSGREGDVRLSLQSIAKGMLPTLLRRDGLRRSGPRSQKAQGSESLSGLVSRMLPTLVARDSKGPGPKHRKGGRDLPSEAGGHLCPTLVRVVHGLPRRMDGSRPRISALGNAVVPECAEVIGHLILELAKQPRLRRRP